VWYDGATMTSWGPHYENFDKDTGLASPQFAELSWEEAFVIDQTMTVALAAEDQPWCDGFIAGLRPALESLGGTAGILREDAGDPLRFFPGGHAFLLSTDNAVN